VLKFANVRFETLWRNCGQLGKKLDENLNFLLACLNLTRKLIMQRFILATVFALFSTSVNAATVLAVSGDDIRGEGMSTEGTFSNEGVGLTFDVNEVLTNASFAFDFECFTSAGCSGLIQWTNTGLGPTSLNQDAVAFSTGLGKTVLTAFSGLELAATTWSVLVSLDPRSSQTAVWSGSQGPASTTGDGRASVVGTDIIDTFNSTNPVRSTFTMSSASLDFELTADPASMAAVPLPAGVLPLSAGLLALGALRRRRKHA